MAVAGDLGVTIDTGDAARLFGEDQARYLLACPFDCAEALMLAAGQAGVPVEAVGRFGGTMVRLAGSEAPLADLAALWRGAFAEKVG